MDKLEVLGEYMLCVDAVMRLLVDYDYAKNCEQINCCLLFTKCVFPSSENKISEFVEESLRFSRMLNLSGKQRAVFNELMSRIERIIPIE